jgi:hypothetical protein
MSMRRDVGKLQQRALLFLKSVRAEQINSGSIQPPLSVFK